MSVVGLLLCPVVRDKPQQSLWGNLDLCQRYSWRKSTLILEGESGPERGQDSAFAMLPPKPPHPRPALSLSCPSLPLSAHPLPIPPLPCLLPNFLCRQIFGHPLVCERLLWPPSHQACSACWWRLLCNCPKAALASMLVTLVATGDRIGLGWKAAIL